VRGRAVILSWFCFLVLCKPVSAALPGWGLFQRCIGVIEDSLAVRHFIYGVKTLFGAVDKEDLFQWVYHKSSAPALIVDEDGLITWANPVAREIFKKPGKELVGSPTMTYWPGEYGTDFHIQNSTMITGNLENSVRTELLPYFNNQPDAGGNRLTLWSVIRTQMIPRNKKQRPKLSIRMISNSSPLEVHEADETLFQQLQRRNDLLEIMSKSSPGGFIIDAGNRISEWLEPTEQMLGWEASEVLRSLPYDGPLGIEPGAFFELSHEVLRTRMAAIRTLSMKAKNGQVLTIVAKATPFFSADGSDIESTYFSVADVTLLNRLQHQVEQLTSQIQATDETLELAAHDIRSILAAAANAATTLQLFRDKLSPTMISNSLSVIARGTARIDRIVGSLQTFDEGSRGEPTTFDVNSLLEEVGEEAKNRSPATQAFVKIEVQCAPAPMVVTFDKDLLFLVLANIARNDADELTSHIPKELSDRVTKDGAASFEEETWSKLSRPPKLDISISAREASGPGLDPGEYVVIRFWDNGSGIPLDQQTSVFDKGKSGKPRQERKGGKGSGLGLYVALGWVKAMGGTITVQSNPNEWTTFEVWIPRATHQRPTRQKIANEEPVLDRTPVAIGPSGTKGRILFLEDQKDFADSFKILFQLHAPALELVVARDVPSALVAIENGAVFDAVITDWSLHGVSAHSVIEAARKKNKNTIVFITSGFVGTESSAATEIQSMGADAYLKKPVDMQGLVATLQSYLKTRKSEPRTANQ
jgi:signal transduction histidine kinase/ActR/RegA family two-component response regulator